MQRDNSFTMLALVGIFAILTLGFGSNKTMPNEIEQIEEYALGTRLDAWVAAGATTIIVRAPIALISGETTTLRLNPGESNDEIVTVTAAAGRKITISSGLTYAHVPGELVVREVQSSMIADDLLLSNLDISGTLELGSEYGASYEPAQYDGQIVQYGIPLAGSGSPDAYSWSVLMTAQTNGAVTEELFIDGDGGSQRLDVAQLHTLAFDILVVARNTAGSAQGAAYHFVGAIRRDATAASTTIIGTTTKDVYEDVAGWDVTVDADNTNAALRIQGTGVAGALINWVAYVRIVETIAVP